MHRKCSNCNRLLALDSRISSVVFVGAAILFFLSGEHRIKRDRALKAIHELRTLLDAVDDVEDLTTGFSRRIWQKITILENLRRALHGGEAAPPPMQTE